MFSKDIIYLIAKSINDPLTFRNFALVSRDYFAICKTLVAEKKKEFARKIVITEFSNCPCCGDDATMWYQLPNGQKHGIYKKHFQGDDFIIVKIYNDGELVYKYTYDIPEEHINDIYYSF